MTSNESLEPMERLQNFLKSFLSEEGVPIYRQRISQMATSGSKFLLIDFEDLLTFDEPLARDLIEKPEEYLKHADDAAWNQLKIEDPEYAEKIKKVRTRFRNLPEAAPLRVLGSEHIEKLIIVNGILVRATPVQPMLITAAFKCRCGNINYVEQTGVLLKIPPVCDNPACRRAGPFDFVEDESTFINSQEIRIQERPEDLPPGQLPRWIDIRLFEDIVDTARPGDRVSVVGIVRPVQQFLSRRGRLRTFNLSLDANFIEVAGKEHEIVQISPE
ncbi:MAG: Minichromosome maintenance protein MCM, partial [Candidatus Bathyarchaeota archaeon]|nr:Minichromosome maintenance protein MCM [Candidatus Bathyarchaeota archaeon]